MELRVTFRGPKTVLLDSGSIEYAAADRATLDSHQIDRVWRVLLEDGNGFANRDFHIETGGRKWWKCVICRMHGAHGPIHFDFMGETGVDEAPPHPEWEELR
jgi:hypothetical protein